MGIKDSKNGSALLIALILMGILMTLALGVSNLLIGAMRDSRVLLEKLEARYAAESGLEQALFAVSQNPPGFEEQKKSALTENIKYEYRIKAAAAQIPVKETYEIQFEKDKYAILGLNESIVIPLFRGTELENAVKKFRVDYYFAPKLTLAGGFISNDLDILRWKIFGIVHDKKMEVISEFVPADKGNSAQNPTCVGTLSHCYNTAKFYERYPTSDGAIEINIAKDFPIETFLNGHTQNFLALTNMANIDLIAGPLSAIDKKKIANIHYRVINEDKQPNLTLPTIKIFSDGSSGKTKQSLDLELKRDSFLPVFNYALYRTAK